MGLAPLRKCWAEFADTTAQALAPWDMRQMQYGPTFWVELGPRPTSGLGASGSKWLSVLLADTEFSDYVTITVGIVCLQVIQQAAAFTYQHQQTTTRRVILLVCFEMLGQFANTLTQNRDLDFR
jgi:hypothetical protein